MISCYVKNENSFFISLELNNAIVLADSLSNLAGEQIRQFDLPEENDLIAMWKPGHMQEYIQAFLDLFPGRKSFIDTNVLRSALLSKNKASSTVKVLDAVFEGTIIPL